jgi:hypothetical protein
MTTPAGTPNTSNPVSHKGFDDSDAHTQASPQGGGQFTGGGEATVRGVNQDQTATGSADVSSSLAKLKGASAMPSGDVRFTSDL